MSAMVVQPSDLEPGASIAAQRYVAPPSDFTAEYAALYTDATTTAGTNFVSIEDDVALASSATPGSNLEAAEQAVFATPGRRRAFVKGYIKAAGKKLHLVPKDFKFSATASAGVGSASFVEIVTVRRGRHHFDEGFVGFADGDTYSGFILIASHIPQSDAVAIAQAADAHIQAILGSGATGASGTT